MRFFDVPVVMSGSHMDKDQLPDQGDSNDSYAERVRHGSSGEPDDTSGLMVRPMMVIMMMMSTHVVTASIVF